MSEVSVIVTLSDKFSPGVKTMTNTVKAFSKEIDGLGAKLKTLDKRQEGLSDSMAAGKKTMKGYRKEFEETGSALSSIKLDGAQDSLQAYSKTLKEVQRNAEKTERELRGMNATASKTGNGNEGLSKMKDMVQKYGINQFGQMASETIQQGIDVFGGSAFGEDNGAILSSTMSGVISGGAIGFSIGGPIGALVGAGIGAAMGAINGNIQKFEKQDDYFKAYYNGILDEQAETKAKDIETGSSIAAGREVDELALSRAFGGDTKEAKEHMEGLVAMSHETPLSYEELVAMSKTMAGQGHRSEDILSTLQAVGAAGTALELDVGAMNTMAAALGQMKTSDTVTAEQLQALDNLGIDATGLLAEKKGMSAEETSKAVAQGEISGSEAAELLRKAMTEKYNGSMTDEMKTFSGLTSTLEGWKQEMQNAYGEGYNEERTYTTGNRVEKTPSWERGFWKGRRYSFSSSEKKTVG